MHDVGLVHRDLKRADILWLPRTHSWALIDFSCVASCSTRVEPVVTLPYSPPEVAQAFLDGVDVEVQASLDCWAMGVLAYELLTGRHWSPADASTETVRSEFVLAVGFPSPRGNGRETSGSWNGSTITYKISRSLLYRFLTAS